MDGASLLLGVYCSMFWFSFFMFFARKRDKTNLAFASLYAMFAAKVVFFRLFPRAPWFSEQHIEVARAIFSCAFGFALAFFALRTLDLDEIRSPIKALLAVIGAGLAVFMPLFMITGASFPLQIQYGVMIASSLVLLALSSIQIIKLKQWRDRQKRFIIPGYLVLLAQGIWFMVFEGLLGRGSSEAYEGPGIIIMAVLLTFAFIDRTQRENTELRELKDSLERKVSERTIQLHESHRQKTMIFVNMAHEIKTPLTLIANYIDQLVGSFGQTRETRILKRNIDKLIRDIGNVLFIEKLESGKHSIGRAGISDCSGIIRQRVRLFTPLAKSRGLGVSLRVDGAALIQADPLALEIILNNLLDNAIKYNKPGGKIMVELKAGSGRCVLTVSDSGIGMSEEGLKGIFDQFYRISSARKSYEGMGIGLHLVKKIVDELGGEITVSSKAGKGSRFSVMLPSRPPLIGERARSMSGVEHPVPDPASEPVFVPSAHIDGRPNLLVVEDNRDMVVFLQGRLERKYNFYCAENGREALETLQDIPRPDLIVSDIMMDEMDGRALLANLRSSDEYGAIPFLFVTAKTAPGEMIEGLREGAVDFITKPFSIDVLMAKIESILVQGEKRKKVLLKELDDDLYSYLVGTSGKTDHDFASTAEKARKDLCSRYRLTARELEIVDMVLEGRMYKEIAGALELSENTVETYRKRIFKKCGVQTRTDLLNLLSSRRRTAPKANTSR